MWSLLDIFYPDSHVFRQVTKVDGPAQPIHAEALLSRG